VSSASPTRRLHNNWTAGQATLPSGFDALFWREYGEATLPTVPFCLSHYRPVRGGFGFTRLTDYAGERSRDA
jgi:hypothetical protein